MTMAAFAIVVAALAVGSVVVLVIRAWLEMRGTRLVTCPETTQPVGVELDLGHVVLSAAGGDPEYRLRDCTRWPEKKDCAQLCLSQIESAPHDCLVREVLGRWYEHKSCALCGRSIAPVHWHDHKPALQTPDGRIREWGDVPVPALPGTLAAGRPVCWSCMIAEEFRHDHPDLAIDRPRPPRPHAHGPQPHP